MAAKPRTAKPRTAKPSTAKPSTAKPSTAKPSTAKPSTAKPSTAKPSTAKPSTAKPSTVEVSTVEVSFTLPADVQADSVALCGEFTEWSADKINLERDGAGAWRVTVALKPGRRYRYRYLLDGERWENAWQADDYIPNPYGSDDSVILVG